MTGPAHSVPRRLNDPQRILRRPVRGGGFSLIELIAVMVIVTILAVTATPILSSLNQGRVGAAARQLLSDLAYTRQRAQETGLTHWMTFDPASDHWTILAENPEQPGRQSAQALTDPATGRDYVITLGRDVFAGVTLTSANFDGDVEVGFNWLGSPLNINSEPLSNAGAVTLSGGVSVAVEPLTGLAVLNPDQ